MAIFLPSNAIGQIDASTAVQPCCLCVATGGKLDDWGGNARLWRVPCYAFKEPLRLVGEIFGSLYVYMFFVVFEGINQPRKERIPRSFNDDD